jgi:hypothetical protein
MVGGSTGHEGRLGGSGPGSFSGSIRMWTTTARPSVAPMPLSRTFRLFRPWRRAVLAVHVLCGAGWMGLDLGLMVLVVTGATSGSGPTVAAAYTAVRLVVPVVVPLLATGMLVTGLLLGWGTTWGLLEWTWVLTKLVIGLVLTALVFVLLVPTALSVPSDLGGSATGVRDAVGAAVRSLMFPPMVSFAALGVSLVLSIWKPWGRTAWALRRREAARTVSPGPGR